MSDLIPMVPDHDIDVLAKRMFRLFRGGDKTRGVFHPDRPKPQDLETVEGALTEELFRNHILGVKGVGVVPITDNADCWFGAIDLDAHGDLPDLDLSELESRVRELDMPLTVCRSKSGGAHLYVFLTEPIPARHLRKALMKWSGLLGFPGAEVFPKQDTLKGRDGVQMRGSWINICNYDVYSDNPLRYCFEGGKPINFTYFLDTAESRMVSPEVILEKSDMRHAEAPPCVVRMLSGEVIGKGLRNESLFTVAVYMRRAFPETWTDQLRSANFRIFDTPLENDEIKKLIDSVGRREYQYKCKIEPCASLCNSNECIKRKYGISPEDKSTMDLGEFPEFSVLQKVTTNPVVWIVHVDGHPITLNTPQLMDFRMVRQSIAENMSRIIPMMKNERWHMALQSLMDKVEIFEAPADTTEDGGLLSRIVEFINKADLSSEGTDKEDRQLILSGQPVVQSLEGVRYVMFRGVDFMAHLKKVKHENTAPNNVWAALRRLGVEYRNIRINEIPRTIWMYKLGYGDEVRFEERDLEPEL